MRRNGMAVFEVTRDYLEKFVDTQIEKNQVLKDFREDLVDMLVCNTPDISEDMEGESSWPFEKKEPAQLYIRDSRSCRFYFFYFEICYLFSKSKIYCCN